MGKRIYISGAVTGTDDYRERFEKAEERLTIRGYSVVNPVKVNGMLPQDTTYDDYMKMSICMLGTCDSIYMLKGYEDSNGANVELAMAEELGLQIYYQSADWREKMLNVFMTR